MPTLKQQELFIRLILDMYYDTKSNRVPLDECISWMQQNLEPEDIFSEKQLSNWAEAAGWIKP